MPRKKQPTTLVTSPAEVVTAPTQNDNKKWAEPYRPLVTNQDAGFEMGENKLAKQMVFNFSQDPGAEVKSRLKNYGYIYHVDQKAWTVNATPLTREIAHKLATEFGGEKGRNPHRSGFGRRCRKSRPFDSITPTSF